jgi:hypothetical protein
VVDFWFWLADDPTAELELLELAELSIIGVMFSTEEIFSDLLGLLSTWNDFWIQFIKLSFEILEKMLRYHFFIR